MTVRKKKALRFVGNFLDLLPLSLNPAKTGLFRFVLFNAIISVINLGKISINLVII